MSTKTLAPEELGLRRTAIAAVAYEAIRQATIASAAGDFPPWSPGGNGSRMQSAVFERVDQALEGESPEQLHDSWVQLKIAQGWTYGEVKDLAARTNPELKPYAELHPEVHAMDELLRTVTYAMARALDMPHVVAGPIVVRAAAPARAVVGAFVEAWPPSVAPVIDQPLTAADIDPEPDDPNESAEDKETRRVARVKLREVAAANGIDKDPIVRIRIDGSPQNIFSRKSTANRWPGAVVFDMTIEEQLNIIRQHTLATNRVGGEAVIS